MTLPPSETILLELFKTALSISVLGFTWFAGNRVASYWELRRKAREADLAIASQFQQLFGEFKEIWRLWKVLRDDTHPPDLTPPEHARWHLLGRAGAAEGKVEAVMVKLTTERTLTPAEIRDLGLFRQAYQTLRQGIREGLLMDFGYRNADYQLFNQLGCRVAHIVAASTSHDRPSPNEACKAFEAVVATRGKDWTRAVEGLREERGLEPWPATGSNSGTDVSCCHPGPAAADAAVRTNGGVAGPQPR